MADRNAIRSLTIISERRTAIRRSPLTQGRILGWALAEEADDYFEMLGPSPYMLLAVNTRPAARSKVPGIVHVDGSARVQTVERESEPLYHRLISQFRDLTGIPLILNTSFNGYGEPMVETPEDAVRSLQSMGLDALAVGDHLVWKSARRSEFHSPTTSSARAAIDSA